MSHEYSHFFRMMDQMEAENKQLKEMLEHAMRTITEKWSEQYPDCTPEMRQWYQNRKNESKH